MKPAILAILGIILAFSAVPYLIASNTERRQSAIQSWPCGGDDEGSTNHGAVVRRCYDDESWSNHRRGTVDNGNRIGSMRHGR